MVGSVVALREGTERLYPHTQTHDHIHAVCVCVAVGSQHVCDVYTQLTLTETVVMET